MKKLLTIILILAIASVALILGCAKAKKEIKIGAILPLSGPNAKYGQNVKMAIDLGIKQTNAAGGIGGKKVHVIYEDSQALPAQGVAAARKLIEIDKVPAIIGEMASSVTLAIAPLAEQNQVVLISPASSNPDITAAGDFIFRTCVSDTYEGSFIAKIVRDSLRLRTAAILRINNDYGQGIERVFEREFIDSSHRVVAGEIFEPEATDFRAQLTKIKAASPECLLLVGYKEMIRALRQYKELGLSTQIISTVMFDDPEILEKAGDAAEGTIFTTWRLDMNRQKALDFLEQFKTEYGSEPSVFAPEAYDAFRLLVLAIEKGGYSGEMIRNELYKTQNYPGVSGEISFDKNGDVVKPLVVETVTAGKFTRFGSL